MKNFRVKHDSLDWIIIGTVIWCIFSFKFVLIDYQDSGVRIDDFLILFIFFLLVAFRKISLVKIHHIAVPFLLFICVQVLSSLYNGSIGRVNVFTALVFSLRSIEYFVFFYIGIYIAKRSIDLTPILKYYLFFLVLLVPLQMLNLVSASSNFDSTRAIGNTYGPYELAILCVFLSFYFHFHIQRSLFKSFTPAIILMATASRTTVFAYLVILAVRNRARLIFAWPLILVVGILIVWVVTNAYESAGSDNLYSRTESLFSPDLIPALEVAYSKISPVVTSQEYINVYFSDVVEDVNSQSGDASAYIRFYRWIVLIKSSFANLDSILFGMGPSFGTSSVDGFYVRVLIETGLVGLILYMWFIVRCLKTAGRFSIIFRYYLIAMFITAFTIDIFYSYKSMIIFWLYLGYIIGNTKRKNSI